MSLSQSAMLCAMHEACVSLMGRDRLSQLVGKAPSTCDMWGVDVVLEGR